jgi:benzoyl-CoA reductase/2-hydroxyglutaryl-CoA dehydratase subunit BcrC/BadD/HgdB
MSGDRGWAAALRSACEHPEASAAAWRASGGQVVGLLGWSAPRELVTAAGMLPVRLSPERLAGLGPADGEGRSERGVAEVPASAGGPALPGGPAAFLHELAPPTAALAAALLSGSLDWIDFLVIGRDREDYTRLFYLLRELRRSGAAPGLVPVAFFDLLRLPSSTSARYNRQRAAGLVAVIGGWAGRPVTPADLTGAAEAAGEIAHSFREIQELRSHPQPRISGTDALAAAIAARVLPAAELRPLLAAALAAGRHEPAAREDSVPDAPLVPSARPARRVFLAGSAVDDLAAYQALEDLGLTIVGEDHEWGDDGSEYPLATRDPLDGIVDRYHFAHGGVARSGLRDQVERTAGRISTAGADGVLYLLGARDEAAGWELPALRECLGPGTPLVPVRLRDQGWYSGATGQPAVADHGPAAVDGWPELGAAGRRLLAELGTADATRAAGHTDTARAAAHPGLADGAAEAGHG